MIILIAYVKNNNHKDSNNNNSDNNNNKKKLQTLETVNSKRTPDTLTEIKYANLPTNN